MEIVIQTGELCMSKRSNSGITSGGSNGKANQTFDQQSLKDTLELYVGGGYDLSTLLNNEQKNHIIDNSTDYNKPLYRVEDARFTADLLDNDDIDGDDFEFNGDFRSFSRKANVINGMLDESSDDYAGITNPVIFEITGNTRQFDMSPYTTNYMTDQAESLVGGRFKTVGEDFRQINGEFIRVIKIQQIQKPSKKKEMKTNKRGVMHGKAK